MPYDMYTLGKKDPRPVPIEVRARRIFKFVVASGTLFLLMSMGGAIIGAPALVPALWWAGRRSRRLGAAGFTLLAAIVMTEVGWAIAYTAVGESRPWITLGPVLGFTATVVVF